MRLHFFWLAFAVACAQPSHFRSPDPLAGTGNGFMHLSKRAGIDYYYRLELLPQGLKLQLQLINWNERPIEMKASDFKIELATQTFLPQSKQALIKEHEQALKALPVGEVRQANYELELIDRFMMDEELTLIPRSPTKAYLLYSKLPAGVKKLALFLGPAAEPTPIIFISHD